MLQTAFQPPCNSVIRVRTRFHRSRNATLPGRIPQITESPAPPQKKTVKEKEKKIIIKLIA